MVLDMTRKYRQAGRTLMVAACFVLGIGCTLGKGGTQQARLQNQKLDWMDRQCRADLPDKTPATMARSQAPMPDPTPMIIPTTDLTVETEAPRLQGDPQVRIVATIGTTPIYEREVREAVYQRLPELLNLPPHEQRVKEKEMFSEELRRIIERELVLDELFAMLGNKKQESALKSLKEASIKEADSRFNEIKNRAGNPPEEEFKAFFQSQGLTMSGIRRHFERSFMMSAYLGERLKPKMSSIGLIDLKDYYDDHPDEFKTEERVKWQSLFIRFDRFRSVEDAKKYVDWLNSRTRRGDDFVKLVNEFDMGDSKLRGGVGFGEEKGKIFPPELEPTVFALKQGESAVVSFETGFHLIRIEERVYAGRKPFDEQVQGEIRRRIGTQVSEREYRKVIETLWRKSQPQILAEQ